MINLLTRYPPVIHSATERINTTSLNDHFIFDYAF